MVSKRSEEAIETAFRAGEAVRGLVASAMRARGGGWSLEDLLDSIFLIESAALIQRGEMIKQNLVIIGIFEGLGQSRKPQSETRSTT